MSLWENLVIDNGNGKFLNLGQHFRHSNSFGQRRGFHLADFTNILTGLYGGAPDDKGDNLRNV